MATLQARTATALDLQPVTPAIGTVIGGIDLRAPLTADAVQTIRQAILDSGVVFFRDQDITREQLRTFAAHFGTPISEPFAASANPDPVIEWKTTPMRRSTAIWHADVTCIPEPVSLIALRSIAVPPVGGDTCWASMYAAYDGLSEPLRNMIDELTAVHSANRVMQLLGGADHSPLKDRSVVIHPVVRVHPESGRKALFVNALWTDRIVELTSPESDHLLALLHDHVKSPEFTVRWRWQANDVALFDNRATQHYAVPDYQVDRMMQKVVLSGDKPYGPRSC